ncbi:response regulator transcription factor [Pedobacter hartonius]|uniref:Helix-turn-helix domain-containing protein n=1 Tax=Pedobacter hartonius TaxID=425514 RepID=A0A1H4GRG5_9SPHI|nr:response regulator [Pedobacter hartonius]SEB12124.1 Helix-turn-helix domain-containing protein [Pedobacter hartonius]
MDATLLLIDDNEDILEFLSDVLGENYRLHLATDGESALKILDDHMISLIISDVMMPGIDGFELCRIVKAKVEYCHIPIILLTAKNTYKAKISGLENGADAYIQKPFSPEFLQLQVSNLLKNRLKIKDHFANSPFEDVRVMAQSKTDELFLKKLDDYVRKNIKDISLDIDKLAKHMNMSRPTFYRKIKSLSSLSPKELIDITRIKKATELISQNEYSMFEITKLTGFSSQTVFGKNFQRHFKMSPMEYQATLLKRSEMQ